MIFNKASIYLGYSLEEFNAIREKLEQHHIKYDYKVRDAHENAVPFSGGGTMRGGTGSFGIDSGFAKQYEVFVSKKDALELPF